MVPVCQHEEVQPFLCHHGRQGSTKVNRQVTALRIARDIITFSSDLFGEPVQVQWLKCTPKVKSVLARYKGDGILSDHYVLEIIFQNGNRYIFDGTAVQYSHKPDQIYLLAKNEYEAKYILEHTGLENVDGSNSGLINTVMQDKNWSSIMGRLNKLWPKLDVPDLSRLPMSDVYQHVILRASDAFRGAYEETNQG